MKHRITDAEMWADLAEHLAGARVNTGYEGICLYLSHLYRYGSIDLSQRERMVRQLYSHRSILAARFLKSSESYFWPRNDLKSRIVACRKLAKLVERKPT